MRFPISPHGSPSGEPRKSAIRCIGWPTGPPTSTTPPTGGKACPSSGKVQDTRLLPCIRTASACSWNGLSVSSGITILVVTIYVKISGALAQGFLGDACKVPEAHPRLPIRSRVSTQVSSGVPCIRAFRTALPTWAEVTILSRVQFDSSTCPSSWLDAQPCVICVVRSVLFLRRRIVRTFGGG